MNLTQETSGLESVTERFKRAGEAA